MMFQHDATFWIALSNLIVLTATLFVLIIYTFKTHEIAVQARHTNLRPVILRDGFLNGWGSIPFMDNVIVPKPPLRFVVHKNIAANIRGHVVTDNVKYKLNFANDINQVANVA